MLVFTIKDSSQDEAFIMIIANHRQRVETSTQTDTKSEAHISTQTEDDNDDDNDCDYDDDDVTTSSEGWLEEDPAAIIEDFSQSASLIVHIDGVAHGIPSDYQTKELITNDLLTFDNHIYENKMFRAGPVEVTNWRSENSSANESEPEVGARCYQNKPIRGETPVEERDDQESMPLAMYSGFPKVVIDCVEAVFADVFDFMDFTPVNKSKPSGDKVNTEDNGKETEDRSADKALREFTEPESDEDVYEEVAFREEQAAFRDNFKIKYVRNYQKEHMSGSESAVTTGSHPITSAETASEENDKEEISLDNYSSLPKVVADCFEAVFAGVSESSFDDSYELSLDGVITEDNGEEPRDVLAETSEPAMNGVPPHASNVISSLDEKLVNIAMEATPEAVWEAPTPTVANQDLIVVEHSIPVETVEEESAHEEVPVDVAAEDVPGNQEEYIIIGDASSEPISCQGPSEDMLKSPEDDIMHESIPQVRSDVIAGVEEAQPHPFIGGDDTDVEMAIDALCQEFCNTTNQGHECANNFLLEEDVSATTIVFLYGEKKERFLTPEGPGKKEKKEENVCNSNETEAVARNQKAESEPDVPVQEKPVEETITPADMPLQDPDKDAVEDHTRSSPVVSQDPDPQEPQVPWIKWW
ncbi:uncharacterized protein [Antennarius striatus]|uniref:uncharacterized protein n=1 Tax=Antennarius striatus TaxID=241820 RepID=UPI0035B0A325